MRFAGFAMIIGLATAWVSEAGSAAAAPDPAEEILQLRNSVPAPRPEDVDSPDHIVAALYATISGPAGERDWNRFRALLLPEARFTTSTIDDAGHPVLRRRSVDDYIDKAGHYFAEHPFYESGITSKIQRFGNIAQVFSSYQSRSAPDAKPFQRGINAIQLLNDGTRWWILSILWDSERKGNELPKAMVK